MDDKAVDTDLVDRIISVEIWVFDPEDRFIFLARVAGAICVDETLCQTAFTLA